MYGQKFAKGLDEVHPFSDSNAVDVCLRESEMVITAKYDESSSKILSRIWGFMSKFVILDRFSKLWVMQTTILGALSPGVFVARNI